MLGIRDKQRHFWICFAQLHGHAKARRVVPLGYTEAAEQMMDRIRLRLVQDRQFAKLMNGFDLYPALSDYVISVEGNVVTTRHMNSTDETRAKTA